jgi:hypothetical protein
LPSGRIFSEGLGEHSSAAVAYGEAAARADNLCERDYLLLQAARAGARQNRSG